MSWIQHRWNRGKDNFWACTICETKSPTRRKPKADGCPGPRYSDDELSTWRFSTGVVANGGTNFALNAMGTSIHIQHFPDYWGFAPHQIAQYVAWLNKRLDQLETLHKELETIETTEDLLNWWEGDAITSNAARIVASAPDELLDEFLDDLPIDENHAEG